MARAGDGRVHGRGVAAGGPAITYKILTDHSGALIVRGTGYDVDHLHQPGAIVPLSASIYPNVLGNSCDRMYR